MSGVETCSPSGELADELLEVGEQAKGAEGEETCSFCELIVELLGDREQAKDGSCGVTCSPSGTF